MIRKNICTVALLALVALSCKNESASAKLDPSTEAIPPASPDAVVAPEPNISAAPAEPKVTVNTPPADGKYPELKFSKSSHDFGDISEGDVVTYSFAFENTGKAPLIISSAKGSCGCTVPEYPKDPLAPGEKGKIKVSFNSSGKPGKQHKTVTITANTEKGTEKLDINATVAPKA